MESNHQFTRGQNAETYQRRRILIADSTPGSRELLHSILDDCGYEVMTVAEGSGFLECAAAFKPHLVILDLQIPKMDGCMTAVLLRRRPDFEKIPIIALIATVSEISADLIATAGFTTHLVKPISPARLRCCVASLL